MKKYVAMLLALLLFALPMIAMASDVALSESTPIEELAEGESGDNYVDEEPIDEELTDDSSDAEITEVIRKMFEEEETELVDHSIELGPSELMPAEGLPEDWLNILLLGTDDRSSNMRTRTDLMIVCSINKKTAEIKLCSIARDIWTTMYNSPTHKINAANVFGGPNLSMRTVNEKFGMNITRYMMVNLQGLAVMIDAVGGIELPISSGERNWINAYLEDYRRFTGSKSIDQNREGRQNLYESGENTHLTGAQAAAYCRNRYMGNDQKRNQRHRNVLMALAGKIKALNPFELAALIPSLLQCVQTNISIPEIIELAGVIPKVELDKIPEDRLPFSGTYQAGMFGTVWCIKPNFERNGELLREYIYGEPVPLKTSEDQ